EEGIGFVPAHVEWMYLKEGWVVEFERPNPRGPWKLGRSSARLSYRPDLVERDRVRLGLSSVPEDQSSASLTDRQGDILGQQDEREMLAEATRRGDIDERADNDIVTHSIRTDLRGKNLLQQKQQGLVKFRQAYEKGSERFVLPGLAKPPFWYVFDV